MQMNIAIRTFEQPVFIPVRFPDPQLVTGPFQIRNIRRFIRRIPDGKDDIHDRFCAKPGYGGGTDMLQSDDPVAQYRTDAPSFPFKEQRPSRLILRQDDAIIVGFSSPMVSL